MNNFLSVWEKSQLKLEDVESPGVKAIRLGLNINPDFWDDFLRMCNNTEELAELLGVRNDQVANWGRRIKSGLSKVKNSDSPHEKIKTKVMNTGEFQ